MFNIVDLKRGEYYHFCYIYKSGRKAAALHFIHMYNVLCRIVQDTMLCSIRSLHKMYMYVEDLTSVIIIFYNSLVM